MYLMRTFAKQYRISISSLQICSYNVFNTREGNGLGIAILSIDVLATAHNS